MNIYLKSATALLAVMAFPISAAQTADEKSDRLADAWKSALAGEEPVLSAKQVAKVNNLAFQAAATRVCDGFELSQDKFLAAIEDATLSEKTDLSEDARAIRQSYILVDFGMRYGLFLAEGEGQDKSFCVNAAELKKSKVPNVWE